MRRSFYFKFLVPFVIVLLGVSLAEVGSKYLMPQELVPAYNIADPELGTHLRRNTRYLERRGPKPYWIAINDFGFRMNNQVDLSDNIKRVIVYGGSFTFGWGVAYADSYFSHLTSKFTDKFANLQLLNAGVGGYSTGHIYKLMKRHIGTLQPSAFIYFFNSNDLIDNMVTDIDYRVTNYIFDADGNVNLVDVLPFSPWKRMLLNQTPYGWLNQHSHLFVALKDGLKKFLKWKTQLEIPDLDKLLREVSFDHNTVAPDTTAKSVEAPESRESTALKPRFTVHTSTISGNRKNLNKFVRVSLAHIERLGELAQQQELPLIVVWIPANSEIYGNVGKELRNDFYQQAKLAFQAYSRSNKFVQFVDPFLRGGTMPIMRHQKNHLHQTDGHFNERGNTWFAELAEKPIEKFLTNIFQDIQLQ